MKIAIFGAGAIGTYFGVKLHRAGLAQVSLVARGLHLAAMREKGLTLISGDEKLTVNPVCTDDPSSLGVQDYVIVTVKSHALPAAAPGIAALVGKRTTVVTALNGVPYWFFHSLDSPWRDHRIESVDPGGILWRTLPPEQVVGSVVYPAGAIVEPGTVRHTHSNRLTLGEPDGSVSERVKMLSEILEKSGMSAPILTDIRNEIWSKLCGNLAFNPLSALTGSTLDRLASVPELRAVAKAQMVEARETGIRLGVGHEIDVEKRLDEAFRVGAHRTSMLQDLERGSPLEIDAVMGAVVELGHMTGQSMPICEMILAMIRERARQSGC